jgi:putative copper resistance protein D
MTWFGAGLDGPLVAVRAVHFAATSIPAGTLLFRAAVINPGASTATPAVAGSCAEIRRLAAISLAIAAATGALWLLLVAASISGLSLTGAMTKDVLTTVVTDTRFGKVAALRGGMATVLAMALAGDRFAAARGLGLAMAFGLTASIAWIGHAGSSGGALGSLQLIADAGHLVAAAVWLGGLVGLAMLLQAARCERNGASFARAREATMRFASIGLITVAVLLSTGLANAWFLVGSWHGLVASLYGRFLLLKLALLAATLAVAAVNRLVLTPRLQRSAGREPGFELLRQLKRNSLAEIGLLSLVYAVVGVLGSIAPALPS